MKRLFLSALILLAAACSKENTDQPILTEETKTISVEVNADPTRTYFDGSTIRWAETGEQLNIIYISNVVDDSRKQAGTDSNYTLTDNRIEFTADFYATDGATTYTFGAFYPYTYKYSTSSINLTVPQEQTPTETSYDPATDILVSQNPVVTSGLPDKITFTFSRLVAFAKMTLVGIEPGEKIEQVVFSSSAKPAGAVEFKVHEANTVENATWYNNYEDITINLNGREATGEDVVWFTTVPTVLSDTDFTVTVTTDKNNYTKTVDLTGKTLEFKRADIAVFRVKDLVKTEKPKAYKLLTDASQLTVGDKVIICTKNTASASAKLLSTTADGNALKFTSNITVTDAIEISEEGLPADAALFTVEAGAKAGTLAFKEANAGYLYGSYLYDADADGHLSKLTYSTTMQEFGTSWVTSLSSSNYAKMYAYYDEVNFRYLNNYYGSKFNFAGTQSTYYYYIYYIDGENPGGDEVPVVTPLETPVVSATATGNSVTAAWEAVEGAKDYTVTCDGKSQTVTTTSATFADLAYETTYTISVVANPADGTTHTASEAGTADATTETDPNAGATATSFTLNFPLEGAVNGADVNDMAIADPNISIRCTGSWRVIGPGQDWAGIFMGTGKKIEFTANNSHKITKIEMTAESGGTLNFGSGLSGKNVTWEASYDQTTKSFTAAGSTRLASVTVYYESK